MGDIIRIPSRNETPWTREEAYEPIEETGGLTEVIVNWIADPRFLSGVYVGAATTVAAAFVWAFL